MSKDELAEVSLEQMRDDIGGCRVGKMAVTGKDALFQRPRTFGAILEHFFAMVALQNEGVGIAHPLDREGGCVAEIGEEADAIVAAMESISDRIHRIVRDVKCLDGEVVDGEFRAGLKELPAAEIRHVAA